MPISKFGFVLPFIAVMGLYSGALGAPVSYQQVNYEITPRWHVNEPITFDVSMTFHGDDSGTTKIQLPAPNPKFGKSLTEVDNIVLTGGEARRDGDDLIVKHAKSAKLILRYTVRSNGAPIKSSPAIVSFALAKDWFAGYAWGLLATPDGRDDAPATLAWREGPDEIRHIDSLDKATTSVGAIGRVLIAGGSGIEVQAITVGHQTTDVVTVGAPKEGREASLKMLAQTVTQARAVFPARGGRYTLGFMWLDTSAGDPFGASASDAALLAFGSTDKPLDYFRDHILHESLHYWIPLQMGKHDIAYLSLNSNSWLTEGLDDAITYRLLLADGHLSLEQYAAHLNKVLREYADNPARKLSSADLDASQTLAAFKLAYPKGELISLALDGAIRAQTGKRLETVVVDTVNHWVESGTNSQATPKDNLISAMNAAGVKDSGALVEALSRAGGRVLLPKDLFGSCAVISQPSSANDDQPQVVTLLPDATAVERQRCTALMGGR